MEPTTTQEQEPQQQQPQPQPHAWREESAASQNPEAEKHRRRIIGKVGTNFPKYSMAAKAHMLSDLLSRFKPPAGDHHGDCCEGRIKDRFHFVKKKEPRKTWNKRKNILKQRNKLAVNDLVLQMKSPCFGIQSDPNEFDLNRGVHSFSFFDKTPREPVPQIDISEDNSQESRAEVTGKFENCSIDSDSHRIMHSAIRDMQQQ